MKDLSKIKIIFIDIDGTLTNNNHEVTEKTKKEIKRVTQKGIKVVLSSGRNINFTKTLSESIYASSIIIASDGSIAYDYKTNKIIYENIINKNYYDILWNYFQKKEIGVIFNTKENGYKNKYFKDPRGKDYIEINDINKIKNEKILQIVISSNDIEKLIESKKLIEALNLETAYFSRSFLKEDYDALRSVDIINKNVSKGSCIKELLKKLNIKKEEALCFGDYNNDIEMFMECGTSVAMDNSSNQIKQLADYITLSNDEDGVADFLEKNI